MDIDTKRRQLRALISDPTQGYLLAADDQRYSLPSSVTRKRYVNIDKLLQNTAALDQFMQVMAWDARQIHSQTSYDKIITSDQRATRLAHQMIKASGNSGPEVIQTDQLNQKAPFGAAPLLLRRRPCLIVTDVIVTGQIVQLMAQRLLDIEATPVAVLAAIEAEKESASSSLGSSLPIYSATQFDLDTLASVPSRVQTLVRSISHKFAKLVADNPETLDHLEWRDLERMMARVMEGLGFDCTLTPPSKDGGKDLILVCHATSGKESFIVELKHWRSGKRVGRQSVLDFLHVVVAENRTGGLFLSTSGYAANSFEGLTKVSRERIRFGGCPKVVLLVQTYVRASNGLWTPPTTLREVLFEATE